MNPIAHNLNVKQLIEILQEIDCQYVDAMVEGELTLVFKRSDFQGEEEDGEIDVKETII